MKASQLVVTSLLLILSFMAGVAWRSADTSSDTVVQQQRTVSEPSTAAVAQREAAPRPDLLESEKHTISLFEQASRSVVFITTLQLSRDYWSRNIFEIPSGTGSGFVWNNEGYIVTNFHVIRGSQVVRVTLADQTTWEAEVVGTAPSKDLAVLKIDAPKNQLYPLAVGDSDNLLVGQSVYAIGNPFGLDQTLTTGVISALGREIESLGRIPIRDVIQTDAAINPGNSGGPLLDSGGRLIGVNTQIYSPSGASAGIGFSIPVDAVKWAVPDLIRYGEIRRPVIGVELISGNMIRRMGLEGALVGRVTPNGPAEDAGLKSTTRDRLGNIDIGDLIVNIEDVPVKSNNDLILALEKFKPGEKVNIKVIRDKKELTIPVVLKSSEDF